MKNSIKMTASLTQLRVQIQGLYFQIGLEDSYHFALDSQFKIKVKVFQSKAKQFPHSVIILCYSLCANSRSHPF